VKPVSHERREKEIARLIEDFLANLARALPKHEEHEYSVEETEEQMKGVVTILSALSQRWSLGIIFLLYMRSLKFNELRELLPGISSRTLTDKLRMLEGSGILTRSVMTSAPVRVRYSLTTSGREIALSCLPLLYQLRKQKLAS
jgi:DNA-binding HxlR family transcriptional regulator